MTEVWRPIPGYEGAYEISNLGRARSLPRLDSRGRRLAGKFLAPIVVGKVETFSLHHQAKRHTLYIWRTVLTVFVRPPLKSEVVRKIDETAPYSSGNIRWDKPNSWLKAARDVRGQKEFCKRGHRLPEEPNRFGQRQCRECGKRAWKEYYARQKKKKQQQNGNG